jgi:hypothetical protein
MDVQIVLTLNINSPYIINHIVAAHPSIMDTHIAKNQSIQDTQLAENEYLN